MARILETLISAPHVIGVLHDTLTWAREWVATEINSSNDNPLFDADSEEVHNSGNFYGGHIAQAAGALSAAVASVADLLDRQPALLVDEKFNLGLPANLASPVPAGDPSAGTHHGFKGARIASSALTAEALHLTMPVSSFSRHPAPRADISSGATWKCLLTLGCTCQPAPMTFPGMRARNW